MLQVELSAYLLFALMLFLIPFRWIGGMILAVTVHELFHVAALCCCGIQIRQVRIKAFGVTLETEEMTPRMEALCALAGPVGSLCTLFLSRYIPEAAVIGLCQGVYNMLPFYPLDGGRVIRSLFPKAVCDATEVFVWIVLLAGGFWIWIRWDMGISAMVIPVWTILIMFRRKIPCKERNLAVQ